MFYACCETENIITENTLTSKFKVVVFKTAETRKEYVNIIASNTKERKEIRLMDITDELCEQYNLKTAEDCKRMIEREWKTTQNREAQRILNRFNKPNYIPTEALRVISMNPENRHPFLENLKKHERDINNHLAIPDINYLMNWCKK